MYHLKFAQLTCDGNSVKQKKKTNCVSGSRCRNTFCCLLVENLTVLDKQNWSCLLVFGLKPQHVYTNSDPVEFWGWNSNLETPRIWPGLETSRYPSLVMRCHKSDVFKLVATGNLKSLSDSKGRDTLEHQIAYPMSYLCQWTLHICLTVQPHADWIQWLLRLIPHAVGCFNIVCNLANIAPQCFCLPAIQVQYPLLIRTCRILDAAGSDQKRILYLDSIFLYFWKPFHQYFRASIESKRTRDRTPSRSAENAWEQ